MQLERRVLNAFCLQTLWSDYRLYSLFAELSGGHKPELPEAGVAPENARRVVVEGTRGWAAFSTRPQQQKGWKN